MTLIKPTYHNLRLAAATALTGAALAACSAFHEPEIPCPEPEPDARTPLALTFSVSTETGITASRAATPFSSPHAPLADASRADDQGHDEEGSDYPETEDYVNLNDFGFFIFAGEEKRLLYKNTNVIASSGDALDMTITGSSGNYTVSLILDDDLVEALLGGGALSPSGDRTMPLTIAVIANHNASRLTPGFDDFDGLTAATAENVGGASTLADFIGIAEGMTFTPSSTDANLLIPMFGLSSFTLTEPQMYYSRPDDRIELGEISLLRAMCKVRVTDNIQGKDAAGYPRVTAARISYPQTGGYVTPRNPADYQNGQQIHGNQEALPDLTGQDTRQMRAGTVKANSLVSYAPAQPLTVTAPEVVISVQRDADSAPQEFTVNLLDPEYTIIAEKWRPMMLRNHVYTLAVQGVTFGASLTLTATVADWEESSFRFDYTDLVSSTDDGVITWEDNTLDDKNVTNHTVTLKPWNAGNAVPTQLTFGLATPKGAQWVASLINTEGDGSALQFLPVEGLTVSDDGKSISGTVPATGNQLITLRIASTIEKPTVTSADKLQIVVATQGGTAWAVATDGKIFNEWTIIQKQQEI